MENKFSFEELDIWKEGMNQCVSVYAKIKDCKDYGFKDQIQRTSVSVPSNISEGFERQTNKEFIHFLYIAKGSCGELRTQLHLARVFNYMESGEVNILIEQNRKLSSKIQNFITYRKKKDPTSIRSSV
jgi:four helix bundle protein